MSPIGYALRNRFEEVCQSELTRLRRKTASLTPADRAEVDAISAEVTRAIASRVEAALAADQAVAEVVARLFAVTPAALR